MLGFKWTASKWDNHYPATEIIKEANIEGGVGLQKTPIPQFYEVVR